MLSRWNGSITLSLPIRPIAALLQVFYAPLRCNIYSFIHGSKAYPGKTGNEVGIQPGQDGNISQEPVNSKQQHYSLYHKSSNSSKWC